MSLSSDFRPFYRPETNRHQFKMDPTDDRSPVCIPFILDRLRKHQALSPSRPFIIGLNGVQGIGKTTLVKALQTTLQDVEGFRTLVVSIDDFYLSRADQVALAASDPGNALLQVRGEPGTHDMTLAAEFLDAIRKGKPTRIPQYDKSAFNGKGDRVDPSRWEPVNEEGEPPVQVVIIEGWCVGFRALDAAEVERKQQHEPSRTLARHSLSHLLVVNENLGRYDVLTDALDAFIYLAAAQTEYVYRWRLQQEEALRRDKGTGMSDEEVEAFVDAYYPAYELYSDKLKAGLFSSGEVKKAQDGKQLTLVVAADRRVKESWIK